MHAFCGEVLCNSVPLCSSQQNHVEFLFGHPCLLNYGMNCFSLEVFVVHGNGNPMAASNVLKDAVTADLPPKKESHVKKDPFNVARGAGRQSRGHTRKDRLDTVIRPDITPLS